MKNNQAILDLAIAEETAKAEELRRQLADQERYLRFLEGKRGGTNGTPAPRESEGVFSGGLFPTAEPTGSVPERVAAVLRKTGGPMRAVDIAAALLPEAAPPEVVTKVNKKVWSALGRRGDLFEKVGRGVFKLK